MFWKYRSLLLIILFTGLFSCKNSSELGFGILPASDDIDAFFIDSFQVITTPMREDTVKTSSLFNNLVGNMYDPIFGKTYAAVFTEFRLPTTDIDVGSPDTLYIDSVVLTLAYATTYGYEDVPQALSVFKVTQPMSPEPDEGYFSNKLFDVDPSAVGRKNLLVPAVTDSVSVLGQLFPPHLRIRLSDHFGQDLLDQSGGPNFSNDTSFKNFFNGFCIAPDTASTPYSASLIYFNLYSTASGIRLYWHTPNTDSNILVFPITFEDVTTNFYKHTYSNSLVGSHLQNQSADGDSLVFIQPLAGIQTRVTIPEISNLHDVIINKAELIISQIQDPERSDSVFLPPTQIIIATLDSAGKIAAIPDADPNIIFPEYGGGQTMVEIIPGDTVSQYKLNISTQIQRLIDGKITDYGLFLIANSRGEVANRLMAGGGTREDAKKIKLNIIYTPIK